MAPDTHKAVMALFKKAMNAAQKGEVFEYQIGEK